MWTWHMVWRANVFEAQEFGEFDREIGAGQGLLPLETIIS